MKIAVLSGKGGAGKTFVAANLAAAAGPAVYVDCDVEEPNGRLFWQPEEVSCTAVNTKLPSFDSEKCIGCRKCVNFCRFHALVFLKDKPMLFPEVCHSCGGCDLVCPAGAVTEQDKEVGHLEIGKRGEVSVVTGVLNPGEASGVPVISAALEQGKKLGKTVIVDCPPGSACPVVESVSKADRCVLVAEPTAFGFDNFCMVYELVRLLGKPCGVVINKMDEPYPPLEDFCQQQNLPILARIPYDPKVAASVADGKILAFQDADTMELFRQILDQIGGTVQ